VSSEQSFLGTGWSFPPSFDLRTREAVMVSNEADIEQSLRILLSTVPGERVMQPAYGCGLKRLLFENFSESTLTEIKHIVQQAILFFEARITLNAVDIDVSHLSNGLLRIHLDYTIRTTNSRYNIVYPFHTGT
jgi:phage baseplate assembly protein W